MDCTALGPIKKRELKFPTNSSCVAKFAEPSLPDESNKNTISALTPLHSEINQISCTLSENQDELS
jgi:hypothetical protein